MQLSKHSAILLKHDLICHEIAQSLIKNTSIPHHELVLYEYLREKVDRDATGPQ